MDGGELFTVYSGPDCETVESQSVMPAVLGNSQVDFILAAIREIVRNEIAASRAKGGVW
jgi:hypothetical protein